MKKHIKYIPANPPLEVRMRRGEKAAIVEWLTLSIKDLEYRMRYVRGLEETKEIQGALRALDDIKEILDGS